MKQKANNNKNKGSLWSRPAKSIIICLITLIALSIGTPSLAALSITGNTVVCLNSPGATWTGTYTITGMTGNPQYFNWVVPNGATIISGAGSPSITVKFSTSSGSGPVVVNTAIGQAILVVYVFMTYTPISISGEPSVCRGQTLTYSISGNTTATTYGWISPSGASLSSISGNSVSVTYSSTFSGGTLQAFGIYATCGYGPYATLTIAQRSSPGSTGNITGSTTVCPGAVGITYSVPVTPNATGYSWTLPNGATIVSGANTNTITVNFPSNYNGGTLSVYATNCAGNGPSSSLAVAAGLPQITTQPISPPMTCEGSGQLSISVAGNNITSYQWYEGNSPLANTGPYSGVNTSTLTISNPPYSLNGKQYKVLVNGSCGNTYSDIATVSIGKVPDISQYPVNLANVCEGSGIASLSVVATSPNIITYQWYEGTTPLTNTGIYSGVNSPSLSITNPNYSYNYKQYKVVLTNVCGSVSTTSTLKVNQLPSITISSNGLIRTGNIIDLAGPSGMATYSWTGPIGFSSTVPNPVVTNNATTDRTGNYTLACTDANGCSNTGSTTLTVNGINTSLPVGSTAGGANVSQSGTANYQIPIIVSPGTNGMQPNISVVYNSLGGDGLLGRGWNLSGISAITRVPNDFYHDGSVKEVNFDINDKFAFDGQRLIATNGTYGADNTEYHTEIEGFSRIYSYGTAGIGPAWFKVITKGGTILEFGNTTSSRIEAQGRTDVLMWYLNKVTDPLGNYMVFTYQEDNTKGEAYIEKIEYTGNETNSLLPYGSVNFYYLQRNDPRFSYIGGSQIMNSVVLSKIVSQYGTAQVREYDFNYANDPFTRLIEIIEKGKDGTAYNSTVIDWSRFAWNYSEKISDLKGKKFFFADFNGDGRQDYISYADKESYSATDEWSLSIANADGTYTVKSTGLLGADFICFYIADFNGDGMDDLLKYSYPKTYLPLLSNGNGFDAKNSITSPYMVDAIIGDFDGDGLTDCLFRKRAQLPAANNWEMYSCDATQQNNMTKKYYFQNGYSFPYDSQTDDIYLDVNGDGKIDCKVTPDGKVTYDKEQFGILPLTYLTRTTFNRRLFDYNANGKTDIKSDSTIIEFNGQGFISNQLIGISSTYEAGDFNGDGITDFVGEISGNQIKIYYGTGTLNYIAKDLAFDGSVSWGISVGDFNGDGLSDIVMSGVNSKYLTVPAPAFYIALSNGTGFSALNRISSPEIRVSFSNFTSGDITGDGLADIIYNNGTSNTDIYLASFSQGKKHLMVRSISNGLNQKTEFEYKPLTDASVYTKGSGAVFPIMDYQGTNYVVSSINVPDGVGGKLINNYTYSNAKIHRRGQGFLGYMQNTITNVSTNTVTTNTFDFDNAYNHVYLKKSETSVAGNPVSESGSSLSFWSLGNKRYLPYTSGSYSTDKLTNTTITNTSNTDINGNLLNTNNGSSIQTYENYNAFGQPGKIYRIGIPNGSGEVPYVRLQEMTYYPNGLLQKSVTDPGKAKAVTSNYTYDFANHVYSVEVSATGLETRTSSVKYDNKDRFVLKQTNSLGHFTEAIYDEALGVVTSSKDINGLMSTFTYDAFGKQTETLGPDGTHSVNTTAWCNGTPLGALYYSQTVTTGAPTVKTYFDFLGRAIKSEAQGFDGRIIVADQIYNTLGQKYKSSEPYYEGSTKLWSTNTYDIYGRLLQTQAPNSTVTNSYSGNTVTTTNTTTGQTASKTLNSLGQLVSATDQGGTIVYSYFPSGKPKTIVTNSSTTSMAYDEYGNQTSLKDPNTGTTNYSYNAYGELISQTDSTGNTYTLTYDKLGRVKTKTGPEGITTYNYDTETNGIGALASVIGPNGINMSYQYDNLSRPKKETQVVDGTSYITGISYTNGKLSNITYPSGFGVNYAYNSIGYLEEIKRADNSNSIWKAEQFNALGQLERCLFGNGLRTIKTYDAAHFLKTAQTTNSGGTFLQNMEYGFDPANGNLLSRKNNKYSLTESFTYDLLDRLTSATVTGQTPINISYQPSGNIDTKSGLGAYSYGNNAGPHALTNVVNTDGIVSPLQQDITYTTFNKAATISENNMLAVFKYGPDQERRKMTIQGNGTDITRIYIGNYEKEVNNGTTRELHYIGAAGEIVAIYEKTSTSGAMFYVHPDHLGSLNVVTNEQGNITEEQSFDAWGRRRNPQNWTYSNVPASYKFYRGYTGHEQLDQFGLINMNGRMYDPSVGRFLSADILVQHPEFTQSYNRYSYCLNNPFKYTDPSGWCYNCGLSNCSCGEVCHSYKDYAYGGWYGPTDAERALWHQTDMSNEDWLYYSSQSSGSSSSYSTFVYQSHKEMEKQWLECNTVDFKIDGVSQGRFQLAFSGSELNGLSYWHISDCRLIEGGEHNFNSESSFEYKEPIDIASKFIIGAEKIAHMSANESRVLPVRNVAEIAKIDEAGVKFLTKITTITKRVGIVGEAFAIGTDGYNLYENFTPGNFGRLGFSITNCIITYTVPEVGPFISFGLAIANGTGGFEWYYDYIDEKYKNEWPFSNH